MTLAHDWGNQDAEYQTRGTLENELGNTDELVAALLPLNELICDGKSVGRKLRLLNQVPQVREEYVRKDSGSVFRA